MRGRGVTGHRELLEHAVATITALTAEKESLTRERDKLQTHVNDCHYFLGDNLPLRDGHRITDGPKTLLEQCQWLKETAEAEQQRLTEATEPLKVAAQEYLDYLHSKKPLGTDEWKLLKGRIITLACNLLLRTPESRGE